MDREYVGIDFHRRRSVIVRKDAAGEQLGWCGSRTIRGDCGGGRGGGPGTGGGDRGDLWLVLGRGSVPGAGRDGASGEPAGVELG